MFKKKTEDKDPNSPVGSTPQATQLLRAVYKGDLRKVEKALKEAAAADDVNAPDLRSGMSAMHMAAERGLEAVIRRLVDANANVNKMSLGPSTYRGTPLHFAASSGKDAVVVLLLGLGAAYDLQDSRGRIALQAAIDERRSGCFSTLLRKLLSRDKALPRVKFIVPDGGTLLHEAVQAGFAPGVSALLKEGLADVNAKNSFGNTALHIAATKGDLLSVGMLLQHSPNVGVLNREGRNALEQAIRCNQFAVVQQLQAFEKHRPHSAPFPSPVPAVAAAAATEPIAVGSAAKGASSPSLPAMPVFRSTSRQPPPTRQWRAASVCQAPPPTPTMPVPGQVVSAPPSPALPTRQKQQSLDEFFDDLLRSLPSKK